MHYFIDGYNLLFRLLRASNDLQAQRKKIIDELSTKIKFIGLDATLVFDAHYQSGEATKSHLKDLEIFFTAAGESADELIISELKRVADPRQETVVTSDKKLAWRARRKAAHSESVEAFMEWLNRRYKNKIRDLKEKRLSLPIAALPVPLLAAPLKADKPPTQKERAENCTDYYAEIFEREYAKSLQDVPQKVKRPLNKSPAKRRKQPLLKAIEDTRSDMERWEDIFEKRSQQL